MNKSILILFLTFFFTLLCSCTQKVVLQNLENGFAKKTGQYIIKYPNDSVRDKLSIIAPDKLIINEFDDGKLNFSYGGRKISYASLDLFKSFDKDEKWALYFDDNKNLWFYSHDTKQTSVWIKNDSLYTEHNFCSEDINIPHAFLEYLKMSKNEICDK